MNLIVTTEIHESHVCKKARVLVKHGGTEIHESQLEIHESHLRNPEIHEVHFS